MTKASEVTVTDAEVREFMRAHQEAVLQKDPGPLPPWMRPNPEERERRSIDYTRQALAAFLAARVPDAHDGRGAHIYTVHWCKGHNALRAAVLRGPG